MKHFLIYSNIHKDPELVTTKRICDYLQKNGQKVSVKVEDGDWKERDLAGVRCAKDDIPTDAEIILVLGGDGTVLQAARETSKLGIPMVGINLGTLGYLTEVEPANLEESLRRLIENDYEYDDRMMLSGLVELKNGSTVEEWSLNDIVITRQGVLQIIQFNIYVNGQFLKAYSGDGVIVTTPTGSTGYNLSAGGPLVAPRAQLIMITPICAHTLNQRSIVLSSEDVIEIEIPEGREGRIQTVEVHFDGSHTIAMSTGDRIRISKSEKMTRFIQLNHVSFLEILHRKMADE